MTYESHLLFSVKDILAVRIVCKRCGTVHSVPPNNWKRFVYHCSNCETKLMQDMSVEERTLQSLGKLLEDLLQINNDRFQLEFELRHAGEGKNG